MKDLRLSRIGTYPLKWGKLHQILDGQFVLAFCLLHNSRNQITTVRNNFHLNDDNQSGYFYPSLTSKCIGLMQSLS